MTIKRSWIYLGTIITIIVVTVILTLTVFNSEEDLAPIGTGISSVM